MIVLGREQDKDFIPSLVFIVIGKKINKYILRKINLFFIFARRKKNQFFVLTFETCQRRLRSKDASVNVSN